LRSEDLEQAYKRALRNEHAAWQDYQQHLDAPENTVRQHLDVWRDSARQVDVARDAYLRSEYAPVGESSDDAAFPRSEPARHLQADLQRAIEEQKSAFTEFERLARKRGTPDRDAYGTWLDALRTTNSVRGHLESERRGRAGGWEAGAPGGARRPRTQLLEDAAPPHDDQEIVRAVAVTAVPGNMGATQFHVGIRNPTGAVYRTVTLFGVAEKVNFARQLEALGYEDERFAGKRPPEGYDLMYSKPRRPAGR
jgi:hypothetical protein